MKMWDYIKNIFLILILIQIIPSILRNIKRQYGSLWEQKTSVGVLPIRGVLYDSSFYIKQLQQFFKDKDIKAILLKIECPGSASGTGELIYREIIALKQENPKPVIALVENICASGGYWIATACDHIIAPGTALIGSIGADLPYLFQLKGFMETYSIRYENVSAGQFKAATNPFIDITPEMQQLLKGVVADSYNQFAESVAKSRKLSLNKLSEWADGKIFTDSKAKKLHLIDEVGSAYYAVIVLKDKAGIEGEVD